MDSTFLIDIGYIRVICKVRKTQHQNPKFDHTRGEISKKLAKKYISFQRRVGGVVGELRKGGKLSFTLSFLFPERLHCCYRYFHCSYPYNYYNYSRTLVNWVSRCLSFFLSASIAATYIFTVPTRTTTIVTLELCALNAEFQHFILDSVKLSYFADTAESGG
jgi:hypothetical protein